MSHDTVEGGVKPPSSVPQREPSFQHLKFVPNWGWHKLAKCRGMTDFFFPSRSVPYAVRMQYIEHAKEVCSTCPVRKDCFEFAKKNNEVNGVWGGVDFHYHRNGKPRHIPDSID